MKLWQITFLSLFALVTAGRIDEEPELVSEQLKQEALLEVEYADFKLKYGVADRRTLDVFFKLFDLWIMLYRLNKADAALEEIVPACEWRQDDLSIKAIQAQAFTRWKQGRFREALVRFHQMEGWLGKNAALSENIGHTYNAIGSLEDAESYFQEALALQSTSDGNKGGVLLGLAGVRERRGAFSEALVSAKEAYDVFKAADNKRGWVTSLTAKAAMQLSKINFVLGRLEDAERNVREALALFELTSGADSPLMSGAWRRLGDILVKQDRLLEARDAYHNAYEVEASKDAFDLVEIVTLHSALVDTHLAKGSLDREAFRKHFDVIRKTLERVVDLHQDGNAGAYYKLAGELFVLGSDCETGVPLLESSVALLVNEKSMDTSGMVRQSEDLIAYCTGRFSSTSDDEIRPQEEGTSTQSEL